MIEGKFFVTRNRKFLAENYTWIDNPRMARMFDHLNEALTLAVRLNAVCVRCNKDYNTTADFEILDPTSNVKLSA